MLALLAAGAAWGRERQHGFAQAWDAAGIWVGLGLLLLSPLALLAVDQAGKPVRFVDATQRGS